MRGPTVLFAVGVILVAAGAKAESLQRPFSIACRGLESFEIGGTYDVDWGWGTIRAKDGSYVVAFTVGPMVTQLVPKERPPGFRWFKTEKIETTTLRYGMNAKQKQMQATLLGASMDGPVNLIAPAADSERFVALARELATAKCERHVRN